MKKILTILYIFSSFISNAQESFFRGNNNYIAPIVFAPSIATTASATSITSNTTVLGGVLSSTGGATTTIGIRYSTDINFGTYSTTVINTNAITGNYTITITGLSDATTYYAKAYATNTVGTTLADVISFSTLAPPFQPPVIVQSGLLLNLDAANPASYSGSGNIWTNLITGNSVPYFTLTGGVFASNDGGVIRFPSTGGSASSSSGFQNLTSYTVEVWVKMAGTRGDYDPTVIGNTNYAPCIFSEKVSGTVNVALSYNARAWGGLPNNSYRYTAAMGGWSLAQPTTNYGSDLNNWVQIIATYNGSVLKLYRNATLIASQTTNLNLRASSLGYYIAHRWDMSDGVYGDYSIVNMYNRELSLSEVTTNYNAIKTRFGL